VRLRERTLLFGDSKSLVGVLTEPAEGGVADRPAVVFLNAGILHRVGPNRLHVRLARVLAEEGLASLRFDHSGIGDSRPRGGGISFARAACDETRQAMDLLAASCGARSFVLAGICSGADNALRAASQDQRVAGAVLIEAYTVPGRGFLVYSYRDKILSLRSWWRLLRGKSELLNEVAPARPETRAEPPPEEPRPETVLPSRAALVADVGRLVERGVRLCLVYAETSPAYYNYRVLLRRPLRRARPGQVRVEVLRDTDHVFTPLDVQERLVEAIRQFCLGVGEGEAAAG
jgi:hypothetical protein